MGTMAHGKTDPATGLFTGVQTCMAVTRPLQHDFHIVFTIDPEAPRRRKLLAKIELPRMRPASYMHSMAHTQNYVVLIAQPLHMSLPHVLSGQSLGEGGLHIGNGTIFQVVHRGDGSVREFHAPSFLVTHVVNSWEEGDDIIMDVTWYEADPEGMMYFKQFLLRNLADKTVRDAWPIGKLFRYRLKVDGSIVVQDLLPAEPETQFELLKIDERRHGRQHCTFYGWQMHGNAYDELWNSTKVGPAFAVAMGKRNLCTGERRGFYAANEYPSEVEFIPNPLGTEEDDGVLIGYVLDGSSNSSFLQVLDARTMTRIARAELPVRLPFAVHSTFFPDNKNEYANLV